MRIELKKIGLLDEAKFEVGNITLICGENNTGKTYATYSLYGYLHFLLGFKKTESFVHFYKVFEEFREVINIDEFKIEFDMINFLEIMNRSIKTSSKNYLNILPSVLAGEEEHFRSSVFKTDVQISQDELEKNLLSIDRVNPFGFKIEIVGQRVRLVLIESLEEAKLDQIFFYMFRTIYLANIPNAFILSTERTGVSMFQTELDVNQNKIIERIQKNNGKDINVFDLVMNHTSRYPEPIRDNIHFIRELDKVTKKTSFIKKKEKENALHQEILNLLYQVVGGKYIVSQEGVYFAPKAKQRMTKSKFLIQSASSSVRSLMMLNFYVLHQAQKGDILMMDEPELNLHPKNQILLARLFALLSNAGIKIFITTHSDYIVRELNNCIMLNNLDEEQIKRLSSRGYLPHHKLDPDKIRAYLAIEDKSRGNTLQTISINPRQGIPIETFDGPIEEQNENQGEIFEEVLRNLDDK